MCVVSGCVSQRMLESQDEGVQFFIWLLHLFSAYLLGWVNLEERHQKKEQAFVPCVLRHVSCRMQTLLPAALFNQPTCSPPVPPVPGTHTGP